MDKKLKRKIIRKLKRFFLYDRSFIKMICFSVVLILILVLGNSFGFVSAEDDISGGSSESDLFLNNADYENSDVYSANNLYVRYIDSDINSTLASNGIFSHTWDFSGAETPSDFDITNIHYYVITGNNYPSVYRIYMFESEDVHLYYDSANTVIALMGTDSDFYVCDVVPWGDGTNLQSPYLVFPTTCTHATGSYNSDLWNQYVTSITFSSSNCILATNSDLLTCDGSPTTGYLFYDVYNYLYNGSYGNGSNNVVNVNYLFDNASGLVGFDNLEGIGSGTIGGGGNDGQTTENNLYLRDCKWNFSIPKWSNLTGYSGNATFSASLNNFQQENLSDFYLQFTFTIHTQRSYVSLGDGSSGTSGGGHGTEVSNSGSTTTGYISGIYKYVDSSTNNDYVQVSLQDFYNMGSSKAFMTLNGIFDRCFKTGFSGSTSDTSFISWYNESIDSSRFTTTKAILYCYATLYDSGGNASGNCVYYYDLLNGTSGVTDSSMSINDNPYVDEDGNVTGTLPEDDIGGNSITNNNSNSGVNVTQTVNVNNDSSDSKSWLWTLITSLLTSGNDDLNVSEAGMSDTLINLVGINPWISLMSTTFGFIPATVWVTLSAAFIIVMGILVVAFILRIILDLL